MPEHGMFLMALLLNDANEKVHMKDCGKKNSSIKLTPIAASLLLLIPVMAPAADISIINGSITAASNGVPVINIKEANISGLSHNVYETLNVGKEGLIFNNGSSASSTVLGGDLAANPNLAGGTAKVILNEVTSQNASTLEGMMEVAGDSAHLIIANPNGITTQGGGFINAQKATLTTGKPNLNEDGSLAGYTVNAGVITVGALQSDSPTEILARSVKVIGAIEASEISVVAGNNAIDADGNVAGTVTASGKATTYGVDVSQLGGMYANRISLINTESGTGVRNEGTIAGGTSGINIASNGKLINNKATLKSSGNITLITNDSLENKTGAITSDKSIFINTASNTINNSSAGNISSTADTYISGGTLNNKNGKMAAGGTLAVNTNGQKLSNTGKSKTAGIEASIVVLETGELDNENGQIHGNYVGLKNTSLTNDGGAIDSSGDVEIESTGNIYNETGLLRSSDGAVNLVTTKAVYNNATKSADTTGADSVGIIAGNGISIEADYLFNRSGKIASAKDIQIATIRDTDNYLGKIESSENVTITGRSLQTSQSGINGVSGVNIDLTDTFSSRIGIVTSSEGDVEINAKKISNDSSIILAKNINITSSSDVDNKNAMLVADEFLTINANGGVNTSGGDMFGYYAGQYFGYTNQQGGLIGGEGLNITAKSLNSDSSRLVAETGDININLSGNMVSDHGQVAANAGNVIINANKVSGNYATIYSSGDVRIDAKGLSNKGGGSITNNTATGIIAADNDIVLNINGDYHNEGWVSSKGDVIITSTGLIDNKHTINSDGDVTLKGKNFSNSKDIAATNTLTVTSDNDVTNGVKGNMTGGVTNVTAKNVTNYGNLVADSILEMTINNNVYNYGNLYTAGNAVINANKIVNTGFWAVVGGAKGFQTTAYTVNILGTVVGQ